MRTPTTAPFGCMWLLYCVPFLAALAAGTAILVFSFVIPNAERNQADDWVETPCVIENMKLFMHKSRNSRGPAIKNIEAKFRYEFGGSTYTSDRVDFLTRMSFGELEEQSIQFVADHPAGTQMVCYVNPAAPKKPSYYPTARRDGGQ